MTPMQRLSQEYEEATYPKDNLNPARLKRLCTDLIARVKELENEAILARAYPARYSPADDYRWHLKIEEQKGYRDYMSGREYRFKLLDMYTGRTLCRDLQISPEVLIHFGPGYEDGMKQSVIRDLFAESFNPKREDLSKRNTMDGLRKVGLVL